MESHEDALDVLDELIDRFGEPPASVKGLVDVSLLRNSAAQLGIERVTQRGDSLIFQQPQFDLEAASYLASQLKKRIMVSAGKEPYLAARVLTGEQPLDVMRQVLDCWSRWAESKELSAS